MGMANWHTYQVLTKRADRLAEMLRGPLSFAAQWSHVWWGVSIEDKKYGLPRIEHLRTTTAAVRFLSVEPLLEDLGMFGLEGINWVIVGGESGHGARPMHESWVVNIQQQCKAAAVAFFFKQWGGVQKSKTGRELNGRTFDEMPERGTRTIPLQRHRQAMVESVLVRSNCRRFPPCATFAASNPPRSM